MAMIKKLKGKLSKLIVKQNKLKVKPKANRNRKSAVPREVEKIGRASCRERV